MSRIDDTKNRELMNHRIELKRLQNKHKNELESIRNQHEKTTNHIKIGQKDEKQGLRNDHELAMAKQIKENEATIERLQQSLNDVKEYTQKKKENIKKQNEAHLATLDIDQKNRLKSKREKFDYQMQEIDHEAQIQLNSLNRRINRKKQELKELGIEQNKEVREESTRKVNFTRNEFMKKHDAETLKYQRALLNQKKNHTKILANNEKSHQKASFNRTKQYSKELSNLQQTHRKQQTQINKMHEKKYAENYKKNEYALQNLVGKKETLLDKLKSHLKKEITKEMALDKDPFYQMHKIEPKVYLNEAADKYIVELPVSEHEVQGVKLTGYKREIKISMDRNFDFKKTGDTGIKNEMKRIETVTSKIPVEHILDSKSIKHSYENGILRYTIGLA